MPRKPVEPEYIDADDLLYDEWVREYPHVHVLQTDKCVKNETGPRCGATGARTNVFNGGL